MREVAGMDLVDRVPATALAIYAHPDDAEVSCGGTLARWAASGCEVHVVVVTRGDKGSSDAATDPEELAGRREGEMEESSRLLGLAGRTCLGYGDGEAEDTPELRRSLVGWVRRLKPEALLCPDPTASFFGHEYVNHRDHRVVGWCALDAVSPAASLPLYFPDTGPAHRVAVVYLSGTLEPDVAVDISSTLETKVAALACHRSQVGVSPEWVESLVRSRAEEAGRMAGVVYAETFRRQYLAP